MSFVIGKDCKIHPSAVINIKNGYIGDRTIIEANAVIEGNYVVFGKESFVGRNVLIGGGSCFDKTSSIIVGDWFHVGFGSHINTAREVKIGNEVALSMNTRLFTHSAFLDSYSLGFDSKWEGITIGNNCAIYGSTNINPGIHIGSNVVVGPHTLVNKDLPDGCFAAGIPVKIIKQNFLPKEKTINEKEHLMNQIIEQIYNRSELDELTIKIEFDKSTESLLVLSKSETVIFDLLNRIIVGRVSLESRIVKDQLRRNGIRFKYEEVDGLWSPWQ